MNLIFKQGLKGKKIKSPLQKVHHSFQSSNNNTAKATFNHPLKLMLPPTPWDLRWYMSPSTKAVQGCHYWPLLTCIHLLLVLPLHDCWVYYKTVQPYFYSSLITSYHFSPHSWCTKVQLNISLSSCLRMSYQHQPRSNYIHCIIPPRYFSLWLIYAGQELEWELC